MPRIGANVIKRPDGRWRAAWSRPGEKTLYFYGKTRNEALRRRADAKREAEQGVSPEAKKIKLSAYLDRWLEVWVKPGNERTYVRRKISADKHIKPALGNKTLGALKPGDVQEFYNALKAKGLSSSTIRSIHAALSLALDSAVKEGRIARNPARLADVPKVERPPAMTVLSPEEARRLLVACKDVPLYGPMIAFCLLHGLRKGEALALSWKDLDLDGLKVRVPGEKTEASKATIPMVPEAAAILRRHKAAQMEMCLKIGGEWRSERRVFLRENGKTPTHSTPNVNLDRITKANGLPRIRFHDLRHSCASILYDLGVDLKDIQTILRHAKLQTTANLYTHVFESRKESVMGKMSVLFSEEQAG